MRSIGTTFATAGLVTITASLLMLTACSSDAGDTAETPTAPLTGVTMVSPAATSITARTATSAAHSDCRPTVAFSGTDDTSIQEIAESVPLPAGASIVTGRVSTDSDYPGQFAIAIDLCGAPIASADELRPVATPFAKAYKSSPAGEQIFALYIANYDTYTTTDNSGEIKIKDPDFQANLWNGQPSEQAEQQQWVVVTD